MARPIDEKIVAMKMDNSDFKRKAVETTGLFGKLQSALAKVPGVNNLSKVTDSLSGISGAAKKVDLSNISSNVEKISSRFSAMGIVATTALVNIANRAVDTGARVLKSLTIDPVMDGFREYETKMGAIGTVLANTEWAGSTLKDVKGTLSVLNDYADKTIYNFGQMTENIGRFTAAGVTLEDSATAIKGLGNLAAISGSSVDQLNTAMYQSSQALASGKLNLEDWNSMVNAGMGGKKTQDSLVATAKAMGKNVDMSDGFRNSIKDGWLTSEVFLATLKKFGEDESMTEAATKVKTFTGFMDALKEGIGSGWATTWEYIIGDYEEASKRWTALSNTLGSVFQKQSDARNKLVGKMADAGIFKGLFAVITNAITGVAKVLDAVGKGIGKAFGGGNTGLLKAMGKGLNAFAKALLPGKKTLEIITDIFQVLFTPISLVVKLLLVLGKVFIAILTVPLKLIGLVLKGVFYLIGAIAGLATSMIDGVSSSNILGKAIGGLKKVFGTLGDWLKTVVSALSTFGSAVAEAFSIIVKGDFTGKGPWGEDSKIVAKLFAIRDAVKTFVSGVVEAWSILVNGKFTGKGPWSEDSKIVNKLFAIRDAVKTFVSGVVEAWNILAFGNFTGKGPWSESSKMVDALFIIRKAVIDTINGIVEAWNILAFGKFTGIGPWAEDSKIVDKLFKIRQAVIEFTKGVVEAWNILAFGNFTGKGPWSQDSLIVNKLFAMRQAVIDFGTGVAEAWNIIALGKFTGIGPWEQGSEIVNKLWKIRDAVEGFVSGVVESWSILAKNTFTGKGPWAEDSRIVDALFRMRDAVVKFGESIAETWTVLTSGKISVNSPWSEDSPIVKGLVKMREGFQNLGKAILNLNFSAVFKPIGILFGLLYDAITSLDASKVLVPIANGFAGITESISNMNLSLAPVASFFGMFFSDIGSAIKWVADQFVKLGGIIKEHLPSGGDLLAGGFVAAMIAVVVMSMKMAKKLFDMFTGWGEIGGGITEVLESASGALNGFATQLKAQALLTAAIAIGVLAASFWVLSKINAEQIGSGLYAMIGSVSALVGALAIMSKYNVTGGGMKAVIQIVALATAFGILSVALRVISGLSWGEISKGIFGLVGVMGTFAGALVVMSKFGGSKLAGSSAQFLAIAGTVYLLVLVIKKIADIDTGKLIKGMTGLAVTMGILTGTLTVMSKFGGGKIAATSLQFLALAGSVLLLVSAIKQIAEIDNVALTIGLVTIGLILGAIAAFSVITSGKGMLTTGIGIGLLAVALNLLLIPILALGNMSLTTLAKGLGAMAIALLAIAGASMLMTGMVASGAGLILLAIGMNLLLIPIAAFAAMPLGALAIGIGALAVGILAIGGAAILLGLAAPALLLGALGIAAVGIALLAGGAGIALFSTGLVTLATMTGSAVVTIVAFLGTLIVGLASLIPKAVDFIFMLIMHIATALRDNIPALAQVILDMLLRLLAVIDENIPKFVEAGTKIITNFMDSMATNIPKIVMSATALMVAFVEGLAAAVQTNGPKFTDAIMTLMAEVMIIVVDTGIAVIQALFGWIPGVTDATNKIGTTAEKTIRDAFGAKKVGETKGKEFAGGVSGKAGDAKNAGTKVGDNAEKGADSANLKKIGTDHGEDFADGISSKISAAKTEGKGLANGGKDGAGGVSMTTTGSNFGKGFASGISGTYNAVVTAAKSMAKKAKNAVTSWLDINSPSRVMRTDGGWFGTGFALGIADKTKMVGENAKGLAVTAKDSLNSFLDGFQLPEEDTELRFKAVVDYDNLDTSKFGEIGKLGTVNAKLDTSTTVGMVTSIPTKLTTGIDEKRQNDNNTAILKQQDEQINLLKQQNALLSNISSKDNSVYLDGKALYQNNKTIQDKQTSIRNIFKGVVSTT